MAMVENWCGYTTKVFSRHMHNMSNLDFRDVTLYILKYQVVKVSLGGSSIKKLVKTALAHCKCSEVFLEHKKYSENDLMQGREDFSLHKVILRILFLCLRITSEHLQAARAVLTSFLYPTASQCIMFKQVQLWHVVLRCPHHLQVQSPPHLHSQSNKRPS